MTPCRAATSRTSSGFPRRTHFAMPREATIAAAATVRGSDPSGRTIRRHVLSRRLDEAVAEGGRREARHARRLAEGARPAEVDVVGDEAHRLLDALGVVDRDRRVHRRDVRGGAVARGLHLEERETGVEDLPAEVEDAPVRGETAREDERPPAACRSGPSSRRRGRCRSGRPA